MKLSLSDARHIFLGAQGLDGGWPLPADSEGAAMVVERLGYVQIDTIAVIERAHHHVLRTRYPGYRPAMLDDLLSRERRVFEGWTHAASYIPMRDYRFYIRRTRFFAERPRTRQWLKENRAVVRQVLERIRTEGPLTSADFADPRDRRGTWWDWKPAKRALETLFDRGELMIAGRRNFQRIYDLTERVLPPDIDTTEPAPDEVARFVVGRALQSHGIVDTRRAGWWLRDRKRVAAALEDAVLEGEAVPVSIDGYGTTSWYASAPLLEQSRDSRPRPKRVHLLSPFDNLIIDRQRTSRFFGFEYRLECYTPAPKRQYGYFTLPVLWGEDLVGRLDPKVDRRKRMFHLRNLVWEPRFQGQDELLPELANALRDFASFHGCKEVVVDPTTPDPTRTALIRALDGCGDRAPAREPVP